MQFDRRTLMATGAMLATAGLHGTPASAQAVATETTPQAPGFYRFKVGDFTVTTVNDGFVLLPLDNLVTNAPLAQVQAYLQEAFLPTAVFHNSFTLTFVQTPDKLIMFDSGTGGQMGPQTGKLASNLRAAGLDLSKVTHVVFSHFHVDHINGLLTADGQPTVPQAEIIVPDGEWSFWGDRSNETRSPDFQKRNFANVEKRFAPYRSRVRQIAAGSEVLPGIHAIAAPGHTPSHTIYRIENGGQQAMFIADTTHRPELFARHPGLHAIIDFDQDLAETTRRRVLDMVATDRIRVTGYHYPFPANGYILKEGADYRFVPANWTSAV